MTDVACEAPVMVARLRATFASGLSRPLRWRHEQLRSLCEALRAGAEHLSEAMHEDMGKPHVEGWLTDIAAVRQDIEGINSHLDQWAASRPVDVPWTLQPARAEVVPEPLGTVLVIGPWNYPVRCLVLPLAFALAAGNTVLAKPSELAPATAQAVADLLHKYLDGDATAVAQGGPEVAQALLEQRWDHIFFTGGGRVGRLVMAAAARHLTPVTLELGGKNPAIVTDKAHIPAAARRITWGKFLNAGQTCVAPDFVLVDAALKDGVVSALCRQVDKFFGREPQSSASFGRVVNAAHFQRLTSLLEATRGRVVRGGTGDPDDRYLAPTVIADVAWDDPLMLGELFGPILPVVAYQELEGALEELRSRDKPLAVYLYSRDRHQVDQVVQGTSSGAVCVNHNAVQLAVPGLPFGGVGASGMGAYHGQTGFDTFSHAKSVLHKPARAEVPLMYPPYTREKERVLRMALGG